jgi:hypothetical protein
MIEHSGRILPFKFNGMPTDASTHRLVEFPQSSMVPSAEVSNVQVGGTGTTKIIARLITISVQLPSIEFTLVT